MSDKFAGTSKEPTNQGAGLVGPNARQADTYDKEWGMGKFKIIATSAIVSVIALVVPSAPASAGVSVGAGVTCDPSGVHCVTTQASAYGAGTTLTGGKVAAVCKAETTCALVTSVTCSVEGKSSTTSLPGPNGAAVVQANTSKLTGHQVCWASTGIFTDVFGYPVVVTDSGCATVTA